MNIQSISSINFRGNSTKYEKPSKKQTILTNLENQPQIDRKRLANAMKALALSSAIVFTPAMISCGKDEIIEDCDHPNHINPPFPVDSTDNVVDTVYTGITYQTPAIEMRRYKVSDRDTSYFGSVTFSPAIVHIPYNAHKSSELQTVMKFIDILGLNSKTLNKEYTPTKSFDYNMVPAQLTWLNEKSGTVNQLKYNGYDSQDKLVKMDLISIPEKGNPVERQLQMIVAGNDKLLVYVYDKEGQNKYTEQLYTLDNDTITQFNINENNNFEKVCEYSKGRNGKTVSATDNNGNEFNLANFDVLTAISEEK